MRRKLETKWLDDVRKTYCHHTFLKLEKCIENSPRSVDDRKGHYTRTELTFKL